MAQAAAMAPAAMAPAAAPAATQATAHVAADAQSAVPPGARRKSDRKRSAPRTIYDEQEAEQ